MVSHRPRGASYAPRGLVLLVGLLLVLPACARTVRLEPSFESDDALVQAVLDGVREKNAAALLKLAVTRDEYERIVWPTLRVSRPEVGMPISYVWDDTSSKSRSYLIETLAKYGGQVFVLERIEFGGAATGHGTYTISPKTRLVVRDDRGHEQTVRLFGSIIRQDGRSKVFSYIVD